MTSGGGDARAGVVEVVLALRLTAQGRTVVDVRTTQPPLAYGTVELAELPLLPQAVQADFGTPSPGEA